MHLLHSPAQQPPFKCTSDWDRFYFQRLCPIIITTTLIKKCKTDTGRHGWDLRGKFNRNQCLLRITLFSAHKLHRSSLSVPALAEASFPSSSKLGRNPIFFRKSEMEDSPRLHIITIWLRGICSETFQLFDFNQSFLATLGNVIVLFPFLRNSELPDSTLEIENGENALIIWCSFLDRFALQIFVDGWGAKYCIRQQCPDNYSFTPLWDHGYVYVIMLDWYFGIDDSY